MIIFFFKQKTAYDMRISDWSSDVCSSDLIMNHHPGPDPGSNRPVRPLRRPPEQSAISHGPRVAKFTIGPAFGRTRWPGVTKAGMADRQHGLRHIQRSEEHTAELQSLMRISYAVFCLKKNRYRYTTFHRPLD